MTRSSRGALAAMATLMMTLAAVPARAEPGLLLVDGTPADSASLATGQQLLLTARSGAMPFAGRQVQLDGFTGIVGYANDLAYVVVLEGSAAVAATAAGAGRMLLIRPYGAPVSVEQFDAIRFAGQWSAQARAAAPAAYASLERIKASQRFGVWFGRLGQTRFNVAASGSARHEQQSRALMGDAAVRDIRFSGVSDALEVERLVVTRFLDALKARDAEAAAALMDPIPFGGRSLTGGADAARVVAARALIDSHDWTQVAGTSAPELRDGAWRAGEAAVQLRSIDDFVFVSRVSGGAQ